MKEAVAYCRVSTDNQAKEDKFGIEAQKEQIMEYARRNDITITHWYIDEGVSGVKESRPEFDKILYGDVNNPPIEYVIVAKNDRIARDINVYFYYKMLLKKKDVTLVSISEDFGQFGVFSNMLEAFTMCVAEMERDNITKRTSMGRGVKAQQGGYSGGAAPFGYRVNDGQLVVDPENAEAVREIFELRSKGVTLNEIAVVMNNKGIVTNRGGKFATSTVQTILNNEQTYRGYYKYGANEWTKGQHEPILK